MNYEYFTAPLTKTGEDGTSEDMTDEEKAAVTEELKALQAQVESGELTVEEAAEDYAASIDSDSNYVQSVNSRDNMTASYLPEAFITSLESMREVPFRSLRAPATWSSCTACRSRTPWKRSSRTKTTASP